MYKFFTAFMAFMMTFSLAFAEKRPDSEMPLTLKQEQAASETIMSRTMLLQFFPEMADYLSACGDEIISILNSFQNITKGGKDHERVMDRSDLNIWTYAPGQDSYRQITQDGGYFSPRISMDGRYISFIRNEKLYRMGMDGNELDMMDRTLPYDRLIGWDGRSRYLLTGIDGNLFSLNTEEGYLQRIELPGTISLDNLLDTLIEIASTSSAGKTVRACRKRDNSFRIVEDCKECVNARVIIDDGYRNLSPSWIHNGDGIIYVSNRKRKCQETFQK